VLVVLGGMGVHAQEAYQLLANASLTHYELAYLAMFAIPLIGTVTLRKRLPLWLRVTSLVGFAATLFSLLISSYPFVSVINPRSYAIKIIGTTLVSNLIATVFYKVRRRGARAAARDAVAVPGAVE
jgi:hypothetical protein